MLISTPDGRAGEEVAEEELRMLAQLLSAHRYVTRQITRLTCYPSLIRAWPYNATEPSMCCP
eukprot:2210108-Rhodomonas_salina.1